MSAMYILFSVFLFSLWALVAALGIENINIWEFIFWTEMLCWITSLVLLKTSTSDKKIKYRKLRELTLQEVTEFSISGLTLILSQACLLTSFRYLSKSGSMIIYEVWPIISMYITPILVAKAWKRVEIKDLLFSLLALFGVALIIIPETNDPFFINTNNATIKYGTLLLPLIGGFLNALSSVIKTRLSHKMEMKSHPLISVLVVQVNYGIFALAFAAAALALNFGFHGAPSHYTPMNIVGILFISTVIFTLGRLSYVIGLLRAKHPNITVLWYLTPVLTVLWLWLAGQSALTSAIVLGSCFIITSNLLMSVKADDRLSYPATILTLLGVSVYCHFVPGLSMGDYYQAISVPLAFYVIIVAFLMDRLIRRDSYEEGLVVEMIRHVENKGPNDKKEQHRIIDKIAAIVRTNDTVAVDKYYRELRNGGLSFMHDVSDKLDALALSRIQGANFGEMLVLSLIGLLTIMTTVIFRPVDFVADCFGVVLSAALVFIYFMVLDQINLRQKFFLEMDDKAQFSLSPEVLRTTRSEVIISAILMLVIIAATTGVMWFNYHV